MSQPSASSRWEFCDDQLARGSRLGACPNSRCSILSESDSTLGYEQVFSPLEYRSDAVPAAECAGLCAERAMSRGLSLSWCGRAYDLKEITGSYVSGLGQPPFDPRMMVGAATAQLMRVGLYSSPNLLSIVANRVLGSLPSALRCCRSAGSPCRPGRSSTSAPSVCSCPRSSARRCLYRKPGPRIVR